MNGFQIIHQITLAEQQDAEAFVAFMRDEYFPAVRKGPTRVGQVTELRLLQRDGTQRSHRFIWLVGWSGILPSTGWRPGLDDDSVASELSNTFGATMKRLDEWQEVAHWRA